MRVFALLFKYNTMVRIIVKPSACPSAPPPPSLPYPPPPTRVAWATPPERYGQPQQDGGRLNCLARHNRGIGNRSSSGSSSSGNSSFCSWGDDGCGGGGTSLPPSNLSRHFICCVSCCCCCCCCHCYCYCSLFAVSKGGAVGFITLAFRYLRTHRSRGMYEEIDETRSDETRRDETGGGRFVVWSVGCFF